MSNKKLTLAIETRSKTGTAGSQALRREGKAPGVLYGHGTDPLHVAFDQKAFDELLHHGARSGVITLTMDGKDADTALIRDIQRNPVTKRLFHVDLQRVSEHEAVHAKVSVTTTGVAKGIRDSGGVMDMLAHEIEIEGPVDQLPDHVEVDVTDLGIHDHVLAGQIKLPDGFKLLTPPDTIVVAVEASKTARQLEEAETATEQLQPEVIGKPADEE